MKKIAFIFLFAIITLTTYSQGDQRIGGGYLGIQVSPVLSWMTSSDQNTTNRDGSNFGMKMGLVGEFHFADRYALTSGAGLVLNHGGTLNYESGNIFRDSLVNNILEPNTPIDIKYNLQMFEVSLGLRMRTDDSLIENLYFYGETPLLFHIRTQARGIWEDDIKQNITKNTGLFNFSWGIGVGAEYDLGNGGIATAGIYLHQGILNTVISYNEEMKLRINALTFKMGVLFNPSP